MNVEKLAIAGALLIKPDVFHDPRGYFFEAFTAKRYQELGLPHHFVQDNISFSLKNVLRGLHFQKTFPQGKLISVLRGKIYDVMVDLRTGRYLGVWLEASTAQQLYVPPGCAHGFYVTSEDALVAYKCTEYYHHDDETGLMWNDPALAINWPLQGVPLLSDKDKIYPPFRALSQQAV